MRVMRLFKGELVREVRGWIDEGLIEPAQGEAILARYDRSLSEMEKPALGYRVLSALAVLCGGAALLLLLSHNWDELSRAGRMLGLIGFTALLNGMGLLRWVRGQRDNAVLWLFAGGIAYGASIMLIAQIYHLGEHYPDGLLWWALGVLPMAWLTASRLLHVLQLSLASLWMFTEFPFSFPWLMPLFVGAALYQVLYRKRLGVLLISALALAVIWLNGLYQWSMLRWQDWRMYDEWAGHLGLTVVLCLLLAALALTQRDHPLRGRRADAALVLGWLGRLGLLLLLVFSYPAAWREFGEDWLFHGGPVCWLLMAVVVISAVLTRWMNMRTRLGLLGVVLLVSAALLLPLSVPPARLAVPMALLINLVLLAIGIALIFSGLNRRLAKRFYGGIVLLLAVVLMRYLDLIGDYLSSALLFAVAGGVLFAAARFWRSAMAREVANEH